MQHTGYTLYNAEIPGQDGTIMIDGTNTRVVVHNATSRIFSPNADELQFYARVNSERLVFETTNWQHVDFTLITGAIRWYAEQLGHHDMQLGVAAPQ